MKFDAKGLALVVIIMGIAVVVAYNMGAKQSATQPTAGATAQSQPDHPATATATAQQGATQNMLPANGATSPNHPAGGAHYTHFRVGNRNVKAMMVDSGYVWVGTSGGAIRYDLKADDYKLYDVNNGSLISNGVFSINKLRGKVFVGSNNLKRKSPLLFCRLPR